MQFLHELKAVEIQLRSILQLSYRFDFDYATERIGISIIVVKIGVEPEIQRVLNLHKDEVRQVQEHYESLTKDSDGRAEEKYREKLRAIDAAVVQRIEDVRQQERQLAEQM